VPSAAEDISNAIAESGGSIDFATFMSIALYGEHGFYTRADGVGRAGRRGDFITSPEVGPLFGLLLARHIDNEWKRCGSPTVFTVVDAGAGPGTLARSILAASPECLPALQYVAVEASATQRAMHPDNIASTVVMPSHIDNGIIIANELLDNLPFHLWVFDGGWRRARVSMGSGGFTEILESVPPPACLPSSARHGARAPEQVAAQRWLGDALGSLTNGSVLVIDYCTPLTAIAVASPWREWLRTYVGHERGGHYLKNPGSQDITCQVMIDQLTYVAEPDGVRTQAQFLQMLGIEELVAEGREVWAANASRPTLDALKMRSRVSEAEALLDPAGLGAFSVLEWRATS
jgi:SAM-dependent MidA family methyltransferase